MSDSIRSEELAKFLSAVDVDHDLAVGFLESAGWDAGMAVEAYYNEWRIRKLPLARQKRDKVLGLVRVRTLGEILEGSRNPTGEGQDMFAGGEKSGTAIRFPEFLIAVNKPRPSNSEDESEEDVSHPNSAFPGSGRRPGGITDFEGSDTLPGAFPNQTTHTPNSARDQV
ncbi:hypothetical protein L0F63_001745, partial [Massospora cicadina]